MTFKKGQSGNPAGRPKGARDKRLSLLLSNEKKLQRKLVQMALKGDMRAMQLCADRLWPKLRPEALPIDVNANSADLSGQGRAVIDAALRGEITSEVLRDIFTALYGQARLVEMTELEERLTALEDHKGMPPWIKQSDEKLPIRGKRRRLNQ
jgi:hypothetical protein